MSVNDGRCYRKLTEVSFGKIKREHTMEWRDARGDHVERNVGMDNEPSRSRFNGMQVFLFN